MQHSTVLNPEGKTDGEVGGSASQRIPLINLLKYRNCRLYHACAGGGFDRRDRDEDGGGFGDREEEGPSRADAADDWGTKKAFVPSSGPTRGGGGGFGDRKEGADRERGGGFGDRYSERRSGFGEGDLDRADNADK